MYPKKRSLAFERPNRPLSRKKTIRLVRGSISWSEMPYYGEPLRIVTKLPPSIKIMEKNCCSKPQYLRNRVVVIPEVGLKSAILARTLIVSPFFEQVTPSRSSGKEGGISTPPPWAIKKYWNLIPLWFSHLHYSIFPSSQLAGCFQDTLLHIIIGKCP